MPEFILEWGIVLILWMQSWGDWLAAPMNALTFTGYTEFYLLIFPALYWCVNPRLGLRTGIALLLSVAINLLVKVAFHDPRPYWLDSQVQLFTEPESTFGIPSGHAQNSVVLWGMLAVYIRKPWAWVLAVVMSLLVGISRMYLGVHFPTDVLLGWILGVLFLVAFLKWEEDFADWFRQFGQGGQIAIAFAGSLGLLLLGALLNWLVQSNWTLPVEWAQNAALQAPDKAIKPFELEPLLITVGALFGIVVGAIVLGDMYRFNAGGAWLKRTGRYLVGMIGAVILFLGLDWLFDLLAINEEGLPGIVLTYLHFGLIGVWITWLAVLVFIKIKLVDYGPDPT